MKSIGPGTIDLLVRFSADSSLIGPTKLKKGFPILFFIAPRLQWDISRTTDPTEMVHLSMSAEMNKEYE